MRLQLVSFDFNWWSQAKSGPKFGEHEMELFSGHNNKLLLQSRTTD